MSGNEFSARARRMREEFDSAFARPREEEPPATEDFLAIRLHGDAFALRAREIGGLAAGRKPTPLPGAPPALLGLAGVRGMLVPAWDLGSLLGYGGVSRGGRWLVLGPGVSDWALAIEAFEGFFRVPGADVHPASPGDAGYAREACAFGGCGRLVIDLAAVLRRIRELSGSST